MTVSPTSEVARRRVRRLGLGLALAMAAAACSEGRPPASGGTVAPDGGVAAGRDAGAQTTDAGADGDAAATAGVGEVLAKDQLKPAWLRHDAQSLYWVQESSTDGSIMKMPLAGGAPATIAKGIVQPDSLRIDDGFAYWIAYGDQGGIHRTSLAGGAVADLVTAPVPIPFRGLALDANYVYYTDAPAGAVRRVPKTGGPPMDVATGLSGPSDIVVDGTEVYVIETGEVGAIAKVPAEGGAPVRIAQNQAAPGSLFVTASDVYWIDAGLFDTATQKYVGAGVMKVAKTGGGAPAMIAAADGAGALFVDGGDVYFTVDDVVMRLRGAGAPAPFAAMQAQPRGVVVAGPHVLWANAGTAPKNFQDGDIRRLAK